MRTYVFLTSQNSLGQRKLVQVHTEKNYVAMTSISVLFDGYDHYFNKKINPHDNYNKTKTTSSKTGRGVGRNRSDRYRTATPVTPATPR